MASVDLVFQGAPLTKGDLVFGDDGSSSVSDALLAGTISLARPTLTARAAVGVGVAGTVTLTRPTLTGEVRYFTDTQRPLVATVAVRWQDGLEHLEEAAQHWADSHAQPAAVASRWQQAVHVFGSSEISFRDASRGNRLGIAGRFQDGHGLHAGQEQGYRDAQRGFRPALGVRWQDGVGVQRGLVSRFQDGTRRIAGEQLVRYQDGRRLRVGVRSVVGSGLGVVRGWSTRYQDAAAPLPGRSHLGPPVEPPVEPCYVPSGDLVFEFPWSADTNLVFICERHVPPDPEPGETIVVPIRRVYVVENHIALQRVDTGDVIEADAFSMSLDADSWTWSWSASLPASALVLIEPGEGGDPVDISATVNGIAYRLTAESYSRERSFAKARVRVQGRGRAAILDAPYAPTLNFASADDFTAQQLAALALTINGVGIGWDVDWGLEDWLVPGGTWSLQGSYIAAVLDIAQAAGGIVQPHRTDATLRIIPRYPAMPASWGGLTPDFEIPADVAAVEGIEWKTLPAYNRIFVSGTTAAGVLGQVTRAGTDGSAVAPMATHALITNAIAARQRGLAELANTGRQALVSLRMPVLEETGVIQPGALVRYVDGATTRLGVVRSTALSWARPVLRQTLGIETHVS